MADYQETTFDINTINLEQDEASREGIRAVMFCAHRLREAYGNPNLQATVHEQMQTNGLIPQVQEERARSLEREESPRRALSREGQKSSPTRRRRSISMTNTRLQRRERHRRDDDKDYEARDMEEKEDSLGHSDDDVLPRRRRPRKSPSRALKRRQPSPSYSPSLSSEGSSDRRHPRQRRRKRSPTPPSSPSYSSSSDASSDASTPKATPKRRGHRRVHASWKRSRKPEKFKEGGKNVTFLSYDGTYGATDRILGFIHSSLTRPLVENASKSVQS